MAANGPQDKTLPSPVLDIQDTNDSESGLLQSASSSSLGKVSIELDKKKRAVVEDENLPKMITAYRASWQMKQHVLNIKKLITRYLEIHETLEKTDDKFAPTSIKKMQALVQWCNKLSTSNINPEEDQEQYYEIFNSLLKAMLDELYQHEGSVYNYSTRMINCGAIRLKAAEIANKPFDFDAFMQDYTLQMLNLRLASLSITDHTQASSSYSSDLSGLSDMEVEVKTSTSVSLKSNAGKSKSAAPPCPPPPPPGPPPAFQANLQSTLSFSSKADVKAESMARLSVGDQHSEQFRPNKLAQIAKAKRKARAEKAKELGITEEAVYEQELLEETKKKEQQPIIVQAKASASAKLVTDAANLKEIISISNRKRAQRESKIAQGVELDPTKIKKKQEKSQQEESQQEESADPLAPSNCLAKFYEAQRRRQTGGARSDEDESSDFSQEWDVDESDEDNGLDPVRFSNSDPAEDEAESVCTSRLKKLT